jgi:hypothetical protein
VGVAYPLLRSLPNLYSWTTRRRVYRLYGELKLVELELEGASTDSTRGDLRARLDELERRASRLRVPRSHALLTYTLRHHIRLVRERL